MPQSTLRCEPLESSREPMDGSSSRRADWGTDSSTDQQASFPHLKSCEIEPTEWCWHIDFRWLKWFIWTEATYPRVILPKKILTNFLETNPRFPHSLSFTNFLQTKFLLVPHSLQSVDFLPLNPSVLTTGVLISVDYRECQLYIKTYQVLVT